MMKHDLRTTEGSYICRMGNAPIGAMCKHTGLRSVKGGKHYGHTLRHVPTRFPQDKGLVVMNRGSHQQIPGEAKDVIFGHNDLVEIIKRR